jgi:hypothetical protein
VHVDDRAEAPCRLEEHLLHDVVDLVVAPEQPVRDGRHVAGVEVVRLLDGDRRARRGLGLRGSDEAEGRAIRGHGHGERL